MKVSLIVPYKEDRGYLDQALESIDRQDYKNYEVIMSQSDKGVSYNLNRGIEKATGDVIKYLCDDDLLTSISLTKSVEAIKDVDFIHGRAINFFESGKRDYYVPKYTEIDFELLSTMPSNCIHGGTLMYKASVFDKVGLFDETLWTAEEFEFNLRCLYHKMKLGYAPHFLYLYRRHEKQKSLGNMDKEYQDSRQRVVQDIREKYLK